MSLLFCFFQAEDGIRDLVRSRGLGDVYKRQHLCQPDDQGDVRHAREFRGDGEERLSDGLSACGGCLLYTSDAADERSSVDLGGRRIIKKTKTQSIWQATTYHST